MKPNITYEQALEKASPRLRERIQESMLLLKKAESLALKYSQNGYRLAFSGGKDSQALYHIALLADVKIEPYMSLTSVDPPQVVRFVRRNYPEVKLIPPKTSMYRLIEKKSTLPTRGIRYCCAILKEADNAGRVNLTGIRKAESFKRSKRNAVEVTRRKFSGNFDEFEEYQDKVLIEKIKKQHKNINTDQFSEPKREEIRCVDGKDGILINPIIDWTDKDVWEFLNDIVEVPHCELYDPPHNQHRIGCLFCPMANKKEVAKMRKQYPKVEQAYKTAISKLLDKRPALFSILDQYTTSQQDKVEKIFDFWTSRDFASMKDWIRATFLQQTINFDE